MMAERRIHTALLACAALATSGAVAQVGDAHAAWEMIDNHCVACHNSEDWAGSVAFDLLSPAEVPLEAEVFETTIRKLRGGLMPPPGNERPNAETLTATVAWLESTLDTAALEPAPATVPLRRLNRREYR